MQQKLDYRTLVYLEMVARRNRHVSIFHTNWRKAEAMRDRKLFIYYWRAGGYDWKDVLK